MSNPARARLFVIGDSISLHYGPALGRAVAPWFEYARKTGAPGRSLDDPRDPHGENAGDSGMVLAYLRAAHAALEADVVLLNCGLHDLKTDLVTGAQQVPLDEYGSNLRSIVDLTARVPWRLVWVETTPVIDAVHAAHAAALGFGRRQADVERYGAVAREVMRSAGVSVIDLHAFTVALGAEDPTGLYCDHVHFVERVREAQAAFLAGWLTGLTGNRAATG